VAAVGPSANTTSTPFVGLLFATGAVRTSGATPTGSGWCVLLSDYS